MEQLRFDLDTGVIVYENIDGTETKDTELEDEE
jgi:hypothetical protein